MKQAHKKRPSRATAFCMPVLLDMGGYFINLVNLKLTQVLSTQFIYNQFITIFTPLIRNNTETKPSIKADSDLFYFH